VESGDYGITRTRDNKFIERSEFPNSVESGMMVEMSIVLKEEAFADHKGECPRCCHINVSVAANSDWINWEVPSISVNFVNDVYYRRNCAVMFQRDDMIQFGSSASGGFVIHSTPTSNVQHILNDGIQNAGEDLQLICEGERQYFRRIQLIDIFIVINGDTIHNAVSNPLQWPTSWLRFYVFI
jgi:hypothetical protein